MSNSNDDPQARIAEIRARHEAFDYGMAHPDTVHWVARESCKGCHRPWPCEQSVLLAELDAATARAERAQAMVRQCADWFGVPLQEYVTRWGVDWMTATNDQMAADIRAALAEGA